MSWMKRPRGSPAAGQGPSQNVYNPTQPPLPPGATPLQVTNQWPQQQNQSQQPNHPAATASNYQPQQQQLQQHQLQQQQPYQQYVWEPQPQTTPAANVYANQNYQQQNYPQQNSYYQYDQQYPGQQQPYQNYPNQQYAQNKTQQQQKGYQKNSEADSWDWDWQDDPSANVQTNANQQRNNTAQMPIEPSHQQNIPPNQQMNTLHQQNIPPSQVINPANVTHQNNVRVPSVPPANNANVLTESFTNSSDSWNWSVEEKAQIDAQQNREATMMHQSNDSMVMHQSRESSMMNQSRESSHDSSVHRQNIHFKSSPSPKPINYPSHAGGPFAQIDSNNVFVPHDDNKNISMDSNLISSMNQSVPANLPATDPNVKTLNDRDAILEHNLLPSLGGTGRRFHSDTLTPQWSIESQPSQDSSDGILSHTESTNRSDEPSKSSNKSSPGYNTSDNTNFNFAQTPVENVMSDNAWDNQSYVDVVQTEGKVELPQESSVNQELIDSVRTLNINRNSVSSNVHNPETHSFNSISENNVVPPHAITPPLARATTLPLPPTNKPPPSTFGAANQNPFKRSGQLSHRNTNKTSLSHMTPPPDNVPIPADPHPAIFPLQEQNIRQPSPGLINVQSAASPSPRIMQQANYPTANLETTPDNSERPDIPPPMNYRPMQYTHQTAIHQNAVENFEVAPSNDRNEYLQTGHLSDANYDNTNFADDTLASRNSQENYPPPGLRRMVLGQPESEFSQNSSFVSDEPPPGLSRMVPGQVNDSNNLYIQPNDDYLDRQIDGQTTESDSLNNSAYLNRVPAVYRQVDGQPTDDESTYNQNVSRISSDRRPVGLDRMVPGEPSSFVMPGFQGQNFGNASEERVVTGFDQSNATEPREQNMDGSDYSEMDPNQMRNIVGRVEPTSDSRSAIQEIQEIIEPELNQRDLNMEGENLQDLSVMSITDYSLVRDQHMDGADIQDEPSQRSADVQDSESDRQHSSQKVTSSKDQSEKGRKFRDDTTGDESERDRYKKGRKEKDRLRTSKERDSRYVDKRDERRSDKDRRGDTSRAERDRDDRPYRKSNRDARYETEDTDYYSDRERERRRGYREGSYASRPPRPETSSRRGDEEGSRRSYERSREERDRRRGRGAEDSYESERDGYSVRRRDKDRGYDPRDDDRDRRYGRDDKGYGSLRKSKSRDERKRDPRYPPRPDSRDPEPTEDDDLNVEMDAGAANSGSLERNRRRRRSLERDRDRDPRRHGHRRDRDRERAYNREYYERYGYPMDSYSQQQQLYQQKLYQQHQQSYQYYENLRRTNPQAYLEIYNKYMSGQATGQQDVARAMAGHYAEGYSSLQGYNQSTSNRLGDERASVHSGRSSANGEGMKDREFNTDASINFGMDNSTMKSERLTPVKFAVAHIKGMLSSTNFVVVNPSYPIDGQPATVEILDLNRILVNDPMRCELTAYPGPLVRGTTHKKTVIEYCEGKIREAMERCSHSQITAGGGGGGSSSQHSERQTAVSVSAVPSSADLPSYVLMWELLILLLRQNGMVVGTDIAELLVKNKRQFEWRSGTSAPPTAARNLSRRGSTSSVTSRSALDMPSEEVAPTCVPDDNPSASLEPEEWNNDASASSRRLGAPRHTTVPHRAPSHATLLETSSREKYVTDRFREYLLFGNGKEALEWAMNNGLWGHALFLASKLDKRTYANVMMRFANGLAASDPLQTLYQLMSGKQPASVTHVLDDKWGDWRPHLAMIISNTTQRPELDRKSIMTLGDTLLSRGDVYAAHFCYLMSREELGPAPAHRLQLLGLPPSASTGTAAANSPPSHAIIMTEIYEYACALNQQHFSLAHLQYYKYLMATRLVDCGLYERALLYMESVAGAIALAPQQYPPSLLARVLELAERLKHFDPEENVGDLLDDVDQSPYDHVEGLLSQTGNRDKPWLTSLRDTLHHLQTQSSAEYERRMSSNQVEPPPMQQDWSAPSYGLQQNYDQQNSHLQPFADLPQSSPYVQQPEQDPYPQMYDPNSLQQQGGGGQTGSYLSPVTFSQHDGGAGLVKDDFDYGGQVTADPGYWNHQQGQTYGYHEDRDTIESLEPPRPQISMPNSNQSRSPPIYDEDHDGVNRSPAKPSPNARSDQKPKESAPSAAKTQASAGWFGGIFNKLSLKPKNQMILPDDKNPSIVWDSEKKRWVNLDSDEQELDTHLPPPPKMSDIRPNINNNNIQQLQQPADAMSSPSPPAIPMSSDPNNLPSTPVPNIFKLQKGRHIKKSYVDVFNPSGAPMRPLPPASEVLGAPLGQTEPPTSYFVPNQGDQQVQPTFYNPAEH